LKNFETPSKPTILEYASRQLTATRALLH
jgi:hypothetical protein